MGTHSRRLRVLLPYFPGLIVVIVCFEFFRVHRHILYFLCPPQIWPILQGVQSLLLENDIRRKGQTWHGVVALGLSLLSVPLSGQSEGTHPHKTHVHKPYTQSHLYLYLIYLPENHESADPSNPNLTPQITGIILVSSFSTCNFHLKTEKPGIWYP